MRVLILLVNLRLIDFTGESSEAFFINVDPPWVHARNHNVDPQVKLKAVNQERISYVFADNALLVNGYLGYIVNL